MCEVFFGLAFWENGYVPNFSAAAVKTCEYMKILKRRPDFMTTLSGALRTPHEKHGGHAASPPLTRNNSLYFRGLLHAQIHNLYDQIGS